MYTTIFFGVAMFTAVVVALVMVILAARSTVSYTHLTLPTKA